MFTFELLQRLSLVLITLSFNDRLPLDEVYFRHFSEVVARDNRVYMGVSGNSILNDLIMFDFEDRIITIANDPRFKQVSISHLTWDGDQLVVVDGIRRILSRYSPDLDYQSKASFGDMDWGPAKGSRARFFYSEPGGSTLVTLQDPEDRGQITLARVDFGKMIVSVLTRRVIDSKQEGYWLPWQDKLLFVHVNLGQIDLLNPITYKTERTIRPGIEPVKKKKYAKPSRPPYFWILHYPHKLEGHLIWATKEAHAPVDTNDYQNSLLRLSPSGVFSLDEKTNFPLAIYDEEALVIDWSGPELGIVPATEVRK